jgi:hypothetical protein
MRDKMQQIRYLSQQLENAVDADEIERIQEEIWALEEEMEIGQDFEYRGHHNRSNFDW